MQPRYNNRQLRRFSQQNTLPVNLRSAGSREAPLQMPTATEQSSYNAHAGSLYPLHAQTGDQSSVLHASDHSSAYNPSSIVYLDPLLPLDIPASVHEPLPVQTYGTSSPFLDVL